MQFQNYCSIPFRMYNALNAKSHCNHYAEMYLLPFFLSRLVSRSSHHIMMTTLVLEEQLLSDTVAGEGDSRDAETRE